MKIRQIITTTLTMLAVAGLFNYSAAQHFLNPIQNNLSIKAGIESRKTDFRWSIAGNTNGTDPNIYSELIYNPIHSAGFYVAADYEVHNRFSIDLGFSRLQTYKGSATDIDYSGDNRTNYIQPAAGDTLFNSNKGRMQNFDVALRYRFIDRGVFNISAGAGYRLSKERYYLLDSEMPDLKTTYDTKWNALRIFVQGVFNFNEKLYLQPHISYQPLQYNATANWNKQTDFEHPVSFKQEATGSGWNYQADLGYRFTKHLGINAAWLYSNWKTETGRDILFLKNGERPETRMNGAFMKSNGWRLSATYTF